MNHYLKNMNELSVTIITLNEEKDLPRALDSVKGFTDEIVVVDSGSTDNTIEIAKQFGARVFHREFDNYGNQKNFATSKAAGEWIISLDADETITPELANEIKKAVKSDQFDAYSIPRKNIILGKFIRYTRWQPELDRHIWLWRRSKGRWEGDIHEEVVVNGKVGRLKSFKIHHQYENVAEFLEMMNRYSELDAKEKIAKGIGFNFFRLLIDPLYNFLVRYVWRLGILDGWRGFVLSYLMAMYHFVVWVKIWERQK
ncbi:glycosyltransferase family 2 protein [Candidatus Daviesbacteria bacterium]|nr:glycosyltransferase family 2 protein [Candidatus Daviesbacteria bacterium]